MDYRRIAVYAAGAILGGTVGYFTGSLICEALWPYYEDEEEFPFPYDDAINEYKGESKEKPIVTNSTREKNTSAKPKMNYAEQYKEGYLTEKGLIDTMRDDKEEVEEPHLYPVSEDDFAENPWDFDHMVLTYYDEDKVLVNAEEKVLSPEEVLGDKDWEILFGQGTTDPDVFYMNDDNLGLTYEIIRVHESYAKDVKGTPKKKKPTGTKKVDENMQPDPEDKKKVEKAPTTRSSRKKKVVDETTDDDTEVEE